MADVQLPQSYFIYFLWGNIIIIACTHGKGDVETNNPDIWANVHRVLVLTEITLDVLLVS